MKAFRTILSLLLIAAMMLTLAACGGRSAGEADKESASDEKTETAPSEDQTVEEETPEEESKSVEEDVDAPSEQPTVEAPAPVEGMFWLAADEFYDDQDALFRYDLYASLLPSFMTEDTDSDEDYFAFSEEYASAHSSMYYYTNINGILRDQSNEELASEHLQDYMENLQSREYTVGEIETVSGSGYTIYLVRGERVSDQETVVDMEAVVCFDGECFSLDIDFHSNASFYPLDPGEQEDGYDPNFVPEQYVKNAEDQFSSLLGSLLFEKNGVK